MALQPGGEYYYKGGKDKRLKRGYNQYHRHHNPLKEEKVKKYGSYYHCCNASNIGHMTHEERLSDLIKKGFSKMSLAIAMFSILITNEFWFDAFDWA